MLWLIAVIAEHQNGQRQLIPITQGPVKCESLIDMMKFVIANEESWATPPQGIKVVGIHIEQAREKQNIVIANEIPKFNPEMN
jgi:hypothetical protein